MTTALHNGSSESPGGTGVWEIGHKIPPPAPAIPPQAPMTVGTATNSDSINDSKNWLTDWTVMLCFLCAAFYPVLAWMAGRWFAADSYTSHGILVPLISAWLAYSQRSILLREGRNPAGAGLWIFALGVLLYAASGLLRIYFAGTLALLLCLTGMLVYWGGWRWLRSLWFPLFFLVFMIPIPEIAIARSNLFLKLFATRAAVGGLDMVGVPVLMDGSRLHLENGELSVGDVCSGLRSIIALIALGSLFAWQYGGRSWKVRAVLLLSVLPVAIAANVLRIFLNVLFAYTFGLVPLFYPILNNTFTGRVDLHLLSGFLVFVFALIFLEAILGVAEFMTGTRKPVETRAAS